MISPSILLLLCTVIIGVASVIWVQAAGRHRRWGLVVWIPSIAMPLLLGTTISSGWPAPGERWATLASIVMIAYAVPFALVGLTALFLFPRRPAMNIWGLLGGIGICIVFLFGPKAFTPRNPEVLVLDQSGKPAAGIVVTVQRDEYDTSPATTVRTNAHGLVRVSTLNRDQWTALVTTTDGVYCRAAIGRPTDILGNRTKYRERKDYWWHPSWGQLGSQIVEYVPPTEGGRLTIRLRSATDRFSPAVIERMHAKIAAFRHGSSPFLEFPNVRRSAELFVVMPELLEAFRARYHSPQPDDRGPTFVLETLADEIGSAGETLAKMRQPNPDQNTRATYETLCVWGKTPTDSPDSRAKIGAKVRVLADDLVDTARPLWNSQGPCGIGGLGNLIQPHIPELIRFMEQEMPERHRRQFSLVIEECHAPAEVLAPYLDSPSRVVQCAVLQALKNTMPVAELRARAAQLSLPGEQSQIQLDLDRILQHAAWRDAEAARKAKQ